MATKTNIQLDMKNKKREKIKKKKTLLTIRVIFVCVEKVFKIKIYEILFKIDYVTINIKIISHIINWK